MKTGIELIMQERQEQIEKHGWTVVHDVKYNHGHYEMDGEWINNPQLIAGASQLLISNDDPFRDVIERDVFRPHGWDKDIWLKMIHKPYKERLIIAGALIAAEIDRIHYLENLPQGTNPLPAQGE